MEETREEVIDLRCYTLALFRKAQCRAVNKVVLDKITEIVEEFDRLDTLLSSIIGD